MRMLLAALAVLILLPGAAAAQMAWCVNDTGGVLEYPTPNAADTTSDVPVVACEAGTTAVLRSVLETAAGDIPLMVGATWDAAESKYTAADAYIAPPDTSTVVGQMQAACFAGEAKLVDITDMISAYWSQAFPPEVTDPAIEMLIQIRKGGRGIGLQTANADWTQADRLEFLQNYGDAGGAMSKPEDVLTEFVNQYELGTDTIPEPPQGRRLVWINPETGAAITTTVEIFGSNQNHDADMVADASDQAIWLRPGAWCAEISG